jgi:hypothetical protein
MQQLLVSRFRAAITSQAWTEAERLLLELREEVEIAWAHCTTNEERCQLQSEVTSTLEWARCVAETGRAHARGKLIRMKSRRAYLDSPAQHDVVRIEG